MTIKSKEEIALMAEAGRRLGVVLRTLRGEVKAGVTTLEFDERARELITANGDRPAFLGYKPNGATKAYPFTLCASINDSVVHGPPGKYVIKDGDLVKLDLGLVHEGFYVDAATTVAVGAVSPEARHLVAITEEALYRGIKAAWPEARLGDIGQAVQSFVEENGFSVVTTLTGHGIGRKLHEEPSVPNFGQAGTGERLRVGMVIAIEPMVNMGSEAVRQLKDDSFVTRDGSLSAHFEHTVVVTNKGPVILTK